MQLRFCGDLMAGFEPRTKNSRLASRVWRNTNWHQLPKLQQE